MAPSDVQRTFPEYITRYILHAVSFSLVELLAVEKKTLEWVECGRIDIDIIPQKIMQKAAD